MTELRILVTESEWIFAKVNFLRESLPTAPAQLKLQQVYNETATKIASHFSGLGMGDAKVPFLSFVQIIGTYVIQLIPYVWRSFAATLRMAEVSRECNLSDNNVSDVSFGIYADEATFKQFLTFRGRLVIELIGAYCTGTARVTDEDGARVSTAFDNPRCVAIVSEADCFLKDSGFIDFWDAVFKHFSSEPCSPDFKICSLPLDSSLFQHSIIPDNYDALARGPMNAAPEGAGATAASAVVPVVPVAVAAVATATAGGNMAAAAAAATAATAEADAFASKVSLSALFCELSPSATHGSHVITTFLKAVDKFLFESVFDLVPRASTKSKAKAKAKAKAVTPTTGQQTLGFATVTPPPQPEPEPVAVMPTDCCIDRVFVDKACKESGAKPPMVHWRGSGGKVQEQKLCLSMIGKCSLVPKAGAVPLCTAFGVDFYLDPMGLDIFDGVTGAFVPAWLVPLTTKIKKTDSPRIELAIRDTIVPFDFEFTLGAAKMKSNVKLTVHSLVMPTDIDDTEDGTLYLLTRPPIPDMVTVEAAKSAPKVRRVPLPAAKKQKTGSAPSGSVSAGSGSGVSITDEADLKNSPLRGHLYV